MTSPKNLRKMIVFTAPSGAGKTTLVRHLLSKYDFLDFSISATTRDKRKGETDGKDYYFLTKENFKEKVANSDFVEWEVYADNYYGTLKSEIDRLWDEGKAIVFDIDVRGAASIKEIYGDLCKVIFVRPPSIETLIKRLTERGTESAETLRKRIKRVKQEMTYENRFDDILVNDVLDVAKKEAEVKTELFLFNELIEEE